MRVCAAALAGYAVPMTRRAAVLLDVDGTLVDSNYFHVLAWSRAFRAHGRTVLLADIHRAVGMGADQMLDRLAGDADAEAIEETWQEEFAALRAEVSATPGAGDLVRGLHARGVTTVYATSGQPQDIEALRRVIGADDCVDEVVNSSEVESSKPAPDIFELAMRRVGVDAAHAVVVGDTRWDVEAAAACGLRCVGVTTGGISAAELRDAGAIDVYETPAQLLEELDKSALARLI
jgi:HAD superfamily hydrolase (TIGR01509 family)